MKKPKKRKEKVIIFSIIATVIILIIATPPLINPVYGSSRYIKNYFLKLSPIGTNWYDTLEIIENKYGKGEEFITSAGYPPVFIRGKTIQVLLNYKFISVYAIATFIFDEEERELIDIEVSKHFDGT